VDFDITEGDRYVGLGFLSGGKFFSVNNGPYYANFDIPATQQRVPDPINVFFYPGAARPQICRASSLLDAYVPSALYLTHQLPDGDDTALANAAAALVLGGNGLWGDLPALTPAQVEFWRGFLSAYKQVRGPAARAYPILRGGMGRSPEIHEKIDPATGTGLVVFFTVGRGEFIHVTQPLAQEPREISGADQAERLPDGRVRLVVRLPENGARTVLLLGKDGGHGAAS
jgi:alpha-galactosidase